MSGSIAEYKPGFNVVTSKGVFVGRHDIRNRKGTKLGRFNVFAAPRDLNVDPSGRRILLTFKETAVELGRRGNWLGHPCCAFDHSKYEGQLFAGLKDGSAVGKWFIPTREILCGRDAEGRKVRPENLYDLRNIGDFRSTFCVSGSDDAPWYWSSSERRGRPDGVWVVVFSDGHDGWDRKDVNRLSSRPVRVELAL